MFAALLLAGIFAAPLATVALFAPANTRGRAAGTWPWIRRLLFALIGTVILGGFIGICLWVLGATVTNVSGALAALLFASLVWLPFTRRWNARAHLCWAWTTFLFAAYLAFMIDWTFASHLGATGTIGGLLLWVLEVLAAVLGCAYLWELCDALGREHWRRRIERAAPAVDDTWRPFVSLHVPAYNEPPDMVIETLRSLRALDYDNYEIIAIDDNTDDESLWRPVEAWCHEHGVKFVHLENWPGYKSGALNYALNHMIDPRTELIGVIDADYQVDPEFLRRCAPLFADPSVGFIQAPQDYRDWQHAPFYRRLYYSYKYFFAVSQPSRNERDGAIFAGTMGLIRRQAVESVGGWDEWCITEDAELSLRLLRAGWSGLHVDRSFGHGVMPLTFEALKGQRFRWCFGGIQILRRNWRWMLPGPRHRDNQLDTGQRWAYLSGAFQWYGDLLGLIFFLFLMAGAINLALGGGVLFRKLTAFLLAAIPVLVALGLVRAVALLRRSTGATWRDAFGAFTIWQSTALVVARASVQGLFARKAEFLRTPKTAEESKVWDAIHGNPAETALALVGLGGMALALTNVSWYGGPLTAGLLAWPTFAFAMAPINSIAAQRAALPPDLSERRRSEWRRLLPPRPVTATVGALGFTAITAGIVLALLATGSKQAVAPQLVGPAQGHPARTAPSSGPSAPASTTPTPSRSSGSTSPSPSSTPSPSKSSPSPTRSPSPSPSRSPSRSPSPSASASPAAKASTAAASTSSATSSTSG
ncbi:MAG TPA: glycosyltransferase [Mycobacteriales bacterium]|nr:glycosyltransferase [Mycobacteriales bacterium]